MSVQSAKSNAKDRSPGTNCTEIGFDFAAQVRPDLVPDGRPALHPVQIMPWVRLVHQLLVPEYPMLVPPTPGSRISDVSTANSWYQHTRHQYRRGVRRSDVTTGHLLADPRGGR
eukprot:3028764-Rhodomonas_salina.3